MLKNAVTTEIPSHKIEIDCRCRPWSADILATSVMCSQSSKAVTKVPCISIEAIRSSEGDSVATIPPPSLSGEVELVDACCLRETLGINFALLTGEHQKPY
jgi:hypothetical protein